MDHDLTTLDDGDLEAAYAAAYRDLQAVRARLKAHSDELSRRTAQHDLEREIARLGDDKLAALVQHVTGAGGVGSTAAVGTPGAN